MKLYDLETYKCMTHSFDLIEKTYRDHIQYSTLGVVKNSRYSERACFNAVIHVSRLFYDTVVTYARPKDKVDVVKFITYFYNKNAMYNPKFKYIPAAVYGYASTKDISENENMVLRYMNSLITVYNRSSKETKIIIRSRDAYRNSAGVADEKSFAAYQISKNRNESLPKLICWISQKYNGYSACGVALLMTYMLNSWGIRGKWDDANEREKGFHWEMD